MYKASREAGVLPSSCSNALRPLASSSRTLRRLLRRLLEHGAPLNATDSAGCTPLHMAARLHIITRHLQELLEAGAGSCILPHLVVLRGLARRLTETFLVENRVVCGKAVLQRFTVQLWCHVRYRTKPWEALQTGPRLADCLIHRWRGK